VLPRHRVAGIGGIFFKARDPRALAAWYRTHLGVPVEPDATFASFSPNAPDAVGSAGDTVWSTFPEQTQYFAPSTAPFMINYRVEDLDAMRAQLRAAGADVDERIEDSEFGRFGWATDPKGNRFELWQPKPLPSPGK
jgi:predicted enzyme related to lactoylglutathione lyase